MNLQSKLCRRSCGVYSGREVNLYSLIRSRCYTNNTRRRIETELAINPTKFALVCQKHRYDCWCIVETTYTWFCTSFFKIKRQSTSCETEHHSQQISIQTGDLIMQIDLASQTKQKAWTDTSYGFTLSFVSPRTTHANSENKGCTTTHPPSNTKWSVPNKKTYRLFKFLKPIASRSKRH